MTNFSKISNQVSTPRVTFLDGIRGLAALMVLLEHVIKDFLVAVQPVKYDSSWLAFITDGHFAVAIFFVLSGYVLSLSQLNSPKNLFHLFITRYCRLTIPILVTCTITYIFLLLGLVYITGPYYQFSHTIYGLLKFSFFDVFFDYDNLRSYSPALWTMSTELLGSYILYGVVRYFRGQFRYDILIPIVIAITLLFFRPYIACFIFGYLIAELNLRYLPLNTKLISPVSLLVFTSVVVMVSIYQESDDWLKCLLASALILAISYSPTLKKVFTNSVFLFLGKISFTLYLVQFTVIFSLSAFMVSKSRAYDVVNLATTNFNIAITVIVCILVGYLLVPIDAYSIKISKKIASRSLKKRFI
jgi:peptidoglycan/LPS O-acetylase OafA/YrhL